MRWVLLRGCELALPFIRQVLDPAIVYVGYSKHSLTAIACQAGDTVIRVRMAVADKRNTACYCCIRQIAVMIWIDVNHNQLIRELAGDIGIVSATFLRAAGYLG